MVRTQIVLAGAEEARAPVMTIAMFHEVLAARDGVAARMVRERRGLGAVRALDEGIARNPLAAWHALRPGHVPGREGRHGVNHRAGRP